MCCDWKNAERFCRCRMAVLRAYHGLLERGEPVTTARQAATMVFRWHHPDIEAPERDHIVSSWLDRGRLH
jgi:hypothetical protein